MTAMMRKGVLPRILFSLLLGAALIAAALEDQVRAAPAGSVWQDNVVISEFRTRGPEGVDDEFIELFNPTSDPIEISGWQVWGSNSAGGTFFIFTFGLSVTLQAGEHYLLVNDATYSGGALEDAFYIGDIPDDGGISLRSSGLPVDEVGLSVGSAYGEGLMLTPLTTNVDRGYARAVGGCYDSDHNDIDFLEVLPSSPQNSGPITLCDAPTVTSTPTNTNTPTRTSTPTYTPTPSNTYAGTPVPPMHLVISELRSRGPSGASDEFVELYNPTGGAVNIGGWVLRRSSDCGTSTSVFLTITSGTILQPGQHFLAAASSGSSISGADQTFSAGLSDGGGVALFNPAASAAVDQAGMCSTTTYREGTALLLLSGSADQSYERGAGGETSCYDTGDNATDFFLKTPAEPQNMASPFTGMCAGILSTWTATATGTSTPTRTPTITRTPSRSRTPTPFPTAYRSSVVMNEFLPHPRSDWNGDGTINTFDEYIELINLGSQSVNLRGWQLDMGVGSAVYTLPDTALLPRQIVVFYHSQTGLALSDGGSTVRLLNPNDLIADAVTYPLVGSADRTWCRLPDGQGTWAFTCYPSPERPNVPVNAPHPDPGPGGRDGCLLADTVPEPVYVAECQDSGFGIWRYRGDDQYWLQDRWKWGIFVE